MAPAGFIYDKGFEFEFENLSSPAVVGSSSAFPRTCCSHHSEIRTHLDIGRDCVAQVESFRGSGIGQV